MAARRKTSSFGRVTLRDVAKRCKLSRYAVSLALRGSGEISPATRERVQRVAAKLGYDPSCQAAARRLALMKYDHAIVNQVVGLIFPFYAHGVRYFDLLFQGLIDTISAEGFAALYFALHNPQTREIVRPLPPVFFRTELDGAILIPMRSDLRSVVASLRGSNGFGQRPVVSLLETLPGCSTVRTDDEQGAQDAAAHLLGLGHTHFVQLVLPQPDGSAARRLDGVGRALSEQGLTADGNLRSFEVAPIALDPTSLREYPVLCPEWQPRGPLVEFLRAHPECTAVLALNDASAIRVWHTLEQAGIRVPEEISIIGFDDTDGKFGGRSANLLTSVRLPLEEAGREAARLILRQVQAQEPGVECLTLPARLMVRSSTARVRPRK